MKIIRMKAKLLLLLAVVVLFASCSKENPSNKEEEKTVHKANRFVYDFTSEAYLWSADIPSFINYRSADNPQDLFELMRNKELDKWSYVSENSEEEMNQFQGVSTTFGYSLAFGRFSNKPTDLFALVEYVYKDSPAQKAGFKRGDILLTVGGTAITEANYLNLYYAPQVEIGLGAINADGAVTTSNVVRKMTAVEMYEDPVIDYRVIEAEGKKVGYLAYAGFYEKSHTKLVEVFENFKGAGVQELILDLRYNPGGDAKTPSYLSSLFAPYDKVKEGAVFLKQQWNELYMAYYESIGENMCTYFAKDIPVNINMNRVFVLTSSKTASASEATISGIKPYMDVVLVGGTTHGKYCGAALLVPDEKNYPGLSNWLLSLVIYKFVNTQGFTEFKDGIAPDYEVEDSGLWGAIPLGSKEDPLIAKALSIITGGDVKSLEQRTIAPEGLVLEPSLGESKSKGGYKFIMQ